MADLQEVAHLQDDAHRLHREAHLFHNARETIVSGKTPDDIPKLDIRPLTTLVLAAVTGPLTGLCDLKMEAPSSKRCDSSEDSDGVDDDTTDEPKPQEGTSKEDPVAGISNWKGPIKQADGDSVTLYEYKPDSSDHRSDPIADVYAVIARPNNAILAVATGCNSGPKSRQTARCAVRGCVETLNKTLLSDSPPKTTQQVATHILSSFGVAQELIMKHEAETTSLCVAVVCPLDKHWEDKQWGLCVVGVGSISCFVWQNTTGIVYDVMSAAMHDATRLKGSLGPSVNGEPDLSGLVCSYVHVAHNDVVFLATRGIYDNFDPFVLLNGTTQKDEKSLPLTLEERNDRKLFALSEVLQTCRAHRKSDHLSALALKEALIEHVVKVTEEKRNFLGKSWQDMKYYGYLSEEERASKEKEIFQLADSYPGKLDHATVVAYQVGLLSERSSHKRTNLFLYSPTITGLTAEDEMIDEGQ